MEREYRRTPDWPEIQTPLTGYELAEIWQDGEQRQGPLSVLGGVPSTHAASHKFGGTDVVGTQDKTANAIPITDGSGTLDVFVSDASTTVKGKVQLATNGESAANKAVQSNDTRLSNSRTPTAHAASHLGGSDDLNLGTAAFLNSGAANGVCPLNASSQVDSGYLPSYVDDVIEVANFAALPVTGESGKIYVTLDDNLTYRWSGTAYIEISKSLALGETSSTAYRGDRGKTAYDHSQIITGNPHGTAIADISTLTGKITPLSDLSRVFRLTGDGIPIFPDNVAGTLYKRDKDWTVTTGWTGGAGVTLSIENSLLKVVQPGGNIASAFVAGATYQNKLIRVIVRSDIELTSIHTVVGSNVFTPMRFNKISANKYVADIYWSRTGSDNLVIIPNYPATTALTWYLESIYIGSGLYDTPVYDKACCNRFTNNGVLPVQAPRGLGMLFQGAQYLQADNPVIGTTGTIALKFKRETIGTTQTLFDNRDSSNRNGVAAVFDVDNQLLFVVRDNTSTPFVSLGSVSDTSATHTLVVSWNGTNIVSYLDSVVSSRSQTSPGVTSTNPFYIGRITTSGGNYLIGTIYDIGYDARIWSADDALRYHNGDDAVDSQQKAVTAVPYSIMTRKSDGRTEVATAVDNLDAVNKAQLDAACADFLYQTYTAGSTFTAGQLGYLHTDGKVYLYDANAEASAKGALYIAVGAITANNAGTFQRSGEYTTTGLSAGAIYYGSETPGVITTTPPATPGAIVRKIGFAQSSTVLFFNPSNDYTTVTSVSGISQTITSFNPSVQFAGGEVGVAYATRKGYVVTTGKQIEYNVEIQLTSKGSSTGQFSVACPDPPAAVFGVASASVFVGAVSYSGHLQATLVGSRFYLSQLSEAGVASDLTNANIANNSVIRLHGVLVAQ